jgi:hypothetical protein
MIILAAIAFAVSITEAETIRVPLNRTNGWQFLSYRKIATNTFRTTPAGLEIGVTNSAAPAVFPLARKSPVIELRASGRISGSLKVPPAKQGEKGFDDYAIRIGLVEAGKRTLSWREKQFAAGWIKKLFALAPPGTGINKIRFFNVGLDPKHIGRSRTHPLSELINETIVAVPNSNGEFAFTNHFNQPISVLAVWISADGDDSHSSFAVTVQRVELETPKKPE